MTDEELEKLFLDTLNVLESHKWSVTEDPASGVYKLYRGFAHYGNYDLMYDSETKDWSYVRVQ